MFKDYKFIGSYKEYRDEIHKIYNDSSLQMLDKINKLTPLILSYEYARTYKPELIYKDQIVSNQVDVIKNKCTEAELEKIKSGESVIKYMKCKTSSSQNVVSWASSIITEDDLQKYFKFYETGNKFIFVKLITSLITNEYQMVVTEDEVIENKIITQI